MSAKPAYSQRTFEDAVKWFIALQDQNGDPDIQAKFQRWLQQHESHQAAYTEAELLWSNLDSIKTSNIPELKAARSARPRSAGYGLASFLLMALLTGWWLDYNAITVNHVTGIGQRRSISLADGSRIELNAATELSVRISWLSREVRLHKGEAIFTVAHEYFRPFDVRSGALLVRDIGTRFNVRSNTDGALVTVLEGEVELSTGQSGQAERLSAGYSRHMDQYNRLQPTEKANLENVSAWTNGRLVFDRTPLAEVVAEIERYHPVSFQFADPRLSDETLSGSFATDDLKPFLRALETILPIRVHRQAKTIVLARR